MAEEGATSIQQLQTNTTENNDGNSRQVVQEILNEIEDKNNNMELNQAQQQYNIDPSIQQTSFAPQNEHEAQMMQQQMMEQQQMMTQQQQQGAMNNHEMMTDYNAMNQMEMPVNKSFTQKLLDMVKSPLIVFAVILLLLLAPTRQLLQKIPQALSQTGNVTFIGNAVIALLGSLLFLVVQIATQKLM